MDALTLELSLPFLAGRAYEAVRYVDGSLDEAQPNAIRVERSEFSDAEPWKVTLAPGGGVAAVFRPLVAPSVANDPQASDD